MPDAELHVDSGQLENEANTNTMIHASGYIAGGNIGVVLSFVLSLFLAIAGQGADLGLWVQW